jgi:hypothetical protein
MNLRDVPDDVYATLAQAAQEHRQSLRLRRNRLAEIAQVVRVGDYVASYVPPRQTGVSLEDAVAAVR